MSDVYEIVVPGRPLLKNERHELTTHRGGKHKGKARMYNAPAFLAFSNHLQLIWRQQRIHAKQSPTLRINSGIWLAEVVSYWDGDITDYGLPAVDADASVSCVLDALQLAGILDDDMRVKRTVADKEHDPVNPRTIIRLERLR